MSNTLETELMTWTAKNDIFYNVLDNLPDVLVNFSNVQDDFSYMLVNFTNV